MSNQNSGNALPVVTGAQQLKEALNESQFSTKKVADRIAEAMERLKRRKGDNLSVVEHQLLVEILALLPDKVLKDIPDFVPQAPLLAFDDGTPILSRAAVHNFLGYSGSGKSTFAKLILREWLLRRYRVDGTGAPLPMEGHEPLSGLIAPEFVDNGVTANTSGGVLWFDTEQSDNTLQKQYQDLLDLLPTGIRERITKRPTEVGELPLLATIPFQAYSTAQKVDLLEVAVMAYRPAIALIDHLGDLVTDTNDNTISDQLLSRLTGIANESGATIINVLHTTKSNRGYGNGFLGSAANRKAEIEFLNADSDGVWKCSKCRTAAKGKTLWLQWEGNRPVLKIPTEIEVEQKQRENEVPERISAKVTELSQFRTKPEIGTILGFNDRSNRDKYLTKHANHFEQSGDKYKLTDEAISSIRGEQ